MSPRENFETSENFSEVVRVGIDPRSEGPELTRDSRLYMERRLTAQCGTAECRQPELVYFRSSTKVISLNPVICFKLLSTYN